MEQLANLAVTTLSGGINNSVTSLTVASTTNFSTTGNFRIVCDQEIMLVTGVAGTTFTVTRGAEGTTAASHTGGVPVRQVLTAGAIQGNIPFLIGTQTLTSGLVTVTFSSIPQNFNHLKLYMITRLSLAGVTNNVLIRFNNDTGANYLYQYILVRKTVLSAAEGLAQTSMLGPLVSGNTSAVGESGVAEFFFAGYSGTTFNKTFLCSNGASINNATNNQFRAALSGQWLNTAAINRIDLVTTSTHMAGSVFSLYGLP